MFLNITMLAGLGGAVVPLVLHLLSRARYRSIDWGAMMFLTGVDSRQRQSTKLKQLLLLLLRMAIVACLAMALARPIVRGAWGAIAQDGRATAVIVIDRSASMGYEENGRTRLDLARDAALGVLSNLRKGDQVVIVTTGDDGTDQNLTPSSDLQAVAARINDLKLAYARADMSEALLKAMDVFSQFEAGNRELYVITDRQTVSWRQVDAAFASVWNDRLSRSETPLRFFILPVGGTQSDNLAVQSVDLLNPPAIAGSASEVEVQIRNFSLTPRAGVPVTLKSGDDVVLNTTVNIAAESMAAVRASVRLPDAGSRVLTAEIKSTGLTTDDKMDVAIDVVAPVRVLIVSGDERPGQAFRSEADFARLALAPFQTLGRPGPDPGLVTVITADKLIDTDLAAFQVVLVVNVSQFSQNEARRLEQFVFGGGGLLVAPGSLTRTEAYNDMLWRGGAGILPASLRPATAGDGSAATALLGIELTHPIFRFLKGRPDPIPSATIGRYFPTGDMRADARVIASYVSGAPFLIDLSLGKGRVLMVTAPLDADWTTLPLSNFYLPFVQSCMRYLASGTLSNRNLAPGDPILYTFPTLIEDKTVAVTLPDGRTEQTDVLRFAQRAEIRFGATGSPGRYAIGFNSAGQATKVDFIVQTPRDEADLTPLADERRGVLAKDLGFEWVDDGKVALAGALENVRSVKEMWGTLLAIVFALALIEMMLSRLWSKQDE